MTLDAHNTESINSILKKFTIAFFSKNLEKYAPIHIPVMKNHIVNENCLTLSHIKYELRVPKTNS